MYKLFLTIILCLTANAFGMQRPAAKFSRLLPTMVHRMTHSGPRHVPLEEVEKDIEELREEISEPNQPQFSKQKYVGENAEVARLLEQVNEIEATIWNVIRERTKVGKFVRDDAEAQWLQAKKEWLHGPNKREELDALRDLVANGKDWIRSAIAQSEAEIASLRQQIEKITKVAEDHVRTVRDLRMSSSESQWLHYCSWIMDRNGPSDVTVLKGLIEDAKPFMEKAKKEEFNQEKNSSKKD